MPRTDVLNRSLIMLVDGLHHQLHKYRRLVAQFLEVDVGTVRRQASFSGIQELRFAPVLAALGIAGASSALPSLAQEVFHLHIEFLRLFGILHIVGVK